MGRNEALQELRKAIAKHHQLFREAWHNSEWSRAEAHWKHLLVERRFEDDSSTRRAHSS